MSKIKILGQNFLKNRVFLRKIAQALEINHDDIVVEIGGGHGELSQFLLEAKKLIIYEIDRKLAETLKNKFSSHPKVEIRNENFLKADLKIFRHHYKLVGNIPYHITGLIFRKIFNKENYPQIFVLTLQKEVGEKILAGNNFLSHWLRVWGEFEKIDFIKSRNFYPRPKVDSIILKIKFYPQPLISEPEKFAQFLKKLFKQPKKMIKNNIDLPKEFETIGSLRPHQLTFETIKKIYQHI